jgi:hypothetical protein
MLSKPILLNNFKRSLGMNEEYLINEEAINEDESGTEKRIDDLANDPKVQSKMGAGADKLKHAFMVLFKRGYGAAQTNWGAVNPNIKKLGKPAAYNAWGYARLNAFIDKREAYKTSDADVADWLNGKGEKPEPK